MATTTLLLWNFDSFPNVIGSSRKLARVQADGPGQNIPIKVLYHCSLKSVLLFPKISWHKTFSIMCLISLCDSSETMKPHRKWKARTGTTSEPCITVSNRKSLILEFKESGKYYPYHFDFDASFFWRNLRGVIRFQFHVSFLRTHRPKTPRVQYIKIVLWFPNLHLPVWIKAKPFQYTTTQIFSIYSL